MRKLGLFIEGLLSNDFDVSAADALFAKLSAGLVAKGHLEAKYSNEKEFNTVIAPGFADFISKFPEITVQDAKDTKKAPYCAVIETYSNGLLAFKFINPNNSFVTISVGNVMNSSYWSRSMFFSRRYNDTERIFEIPKDLYDKAVKMLKRFARP